MTICRLSVVLATSQPWPECGPALRALIPQLEALGGELIVGDGHGDGVLAQELASCVRVIREPGASVLRLRARGIHAARGELVAVTEDHCVPRADFCAQVLAAHERHPTAVVIGGAVENGARTALADWANYFFANEPAWPPLRGIWNAPITGPANVSYKRAVLARYPDDGLGEGEFRDRLAAEAQLMLNDPGPVVEHIQVLGGVGTCLHHFHDGRCVASSRRERFRGTRWLRELAKDLALPIRVPVASARIVARSAYRHPEVLPTIVASIPWIVAVAAAHSLGELVGILAGPGTSPERMR